MMLFVRGASLALCGILAGCGAQQGDERATDGAGPGAGIDRDGGVAVAFPSQPDAAALGPSVCAAEQHAAERLGLDVFVLLDQSGSMTENEDRWTPVTTALLAFVEHPASTGVGVGLQYFPLGAQKTSDPVICEVGTYARPAVPFGLLPMHAESVRTSLASHAFGKAEAEAPQHWGTPTRPAVEGVLPYVEDWAAKHADRRAALVLATDRLPTSFCARNRVADVASTLAAAASKVPTYVIGIGRVDNLETLAAAGGTGQPAFVIDTADPAKAQAAFLAALEAVRASALPCAFRLPEAPQGGLDLDAINVELTSGGSRAVIPRAPSASACEAGTVAWHFDDPARPSALVMCPAACERVRGAEAIAIAVGCRVVVIE